LRLDGSSTVDVVSNELKNLVQKKADDFRDHRLLDYDTAQIEKLNVKTAAGEIEATKEHDGWSVDKPLKARGDNQKITDLIAQTINARIDTFLPDNGADLTAYGLSEPRGTITLTPKDASKPAVLQVGQPTEKDKGKVFGRLSNRESIYILPATILDVLNIKPNDIRDKHLLRLNLDVVDRVHIAPAGKPEITLARKQEEWTLPDSGNAPANATLVKQFVTALQSQQITAFVADEISDLPKYGLDKPSLKVTFSSFASQNTAESQAGETPFLTVDFGKVEGDVIYARLENEPYVVSVSRIILNAIPTDPAQLQDLAIYNLKPEDLATMEITRDGQTVDLERAGGAWKLSNGAVTLNQTGVQSLLNTLASLHAVRWTGSSTAGIGLEKPALIISFTTTDKKTGKLTVGTANSESMWNAASEGHAGAFLINRPDYEVLHSDLVEIAPPAASPSADPSGTPSGVK